MMRMFSPQKTSSSYPRIKSAGSFCVNVLTDEQEDVCRVFAQSGGDKFRGVGWRPAPSGSPILHDVLAWVDCRIETEGAPQSSTALRQVSSGRRSAGVKIMVAPLQLNEPLSLGTTLKAA